MGVAVVCGIAIACFVIPSVAAVVASAAALLWGVLKFTGTAMMQFGSDVLASVKNVAQLLLEDGPRLIMDAAEIALGGGGGGGGTVGSESMGVIVGVTKDVASLGKLMTAYLKRATTVFVALGIEDPDHRLLLLPLFIFVVGVLWLLRQAAVLMAVSFMTMALLVCIAVMLVVFAVALRNAMAKSFVIRDRNLQKQLMSQAAVCAVAAYDMPMSEHQRTLLASQNLTVMGAHPKVLLAQGSDAIFVAFRGTDNTEDIVSDVIIAPVAHGDHLLHRGASAYTYDVTGMH